MARWVLQSALSAGSLWPPGLGPRVRAGPPGQKSPARTVDSGGWGREAGGSGRRLAALRLRVPQLQPGRTAPPGPQAPRGGSGLGHWPPGAWVGRGSGPGVGLLALPAAAEGEERGGRAAAGPWGRGGGGVPPPRIRNPNSQTMAPTLGLKGNHYLICIQINKHLRSTHFMSGAVLDPSGCKVANLGFLPKLATH